jgi:hypothetical protein
LPGRNRRRWKPRTDFGGWNDDRKAGGNAGFFVERKLLEIVMAGLDPAIHLLRKALSKIDGYAGQARV